MYECEQRHMGPIETAMKEMDYQTGPRDGIAMPPRDERPASVAEVLRDTVACMQRALFITGKIMNSLTGVLPNEVNIKNPDNMAEHVRLVNGLGNELLQRLEDLTRSIVG